MGKTYKEGHHFLAENGFTGSSEGRTIVRSYMRGGAVKQKRMEDLRAPAFGQTAKLSFKPKKG